VREVLRVGLDALTILLEIAWAKAITAEGRMVGDGHATVD
jgi:hypothetical protein